MKYAILVYETPEEFAERDDDAARATFWGAYTAYGQELGQGGVAAGGAGLLPPHTATTVRVRGGSRQVLDGPYADTKEQLGGFFLIEAADLDAAIAWAEKCPSVTRGCVEIRPVMTM